MMNIIINNHLFNVLVATTPYQLEKGLMFKDYLPPKSGMLFIFQTSNYYSMWMKNTYIPLDIIFINEEFIIVDLYSCAKPFDLTHISSKKMCKYVLELNCGDISLYEIKIGQKVIF